MENFEIYKADDEKRLVFGWASIAITVDGQVLEDRQGDMIEPEDLEEAAYEYVLYFRDTGEEHLPGYRKKGKLVESVVLTQEKQRAMGIPEGILPVGWWLGFYIEDDDAWRRVKDGTYKMFSIEGKAERLPVEKQVKPGAGVLVVRDGKLLTGTRLESRTKGQICGPGGHIEAGETPAEAAAREAREEFGIECRRLKPIGQSEDGLTHMFMCYDFTGEPKTDGKEMTDLQWRTPEELEDLKLFAPFEESLNHVPRSVAKSFDEILKFNPYHGAHGYFSTANSATSFTYSLGKSRAHDLAIEREKQRTSGASGGESKGNQFTQAVKDYKKKNPTAGTPSIMGGSKEQQAEAIKAIGQEYDYPKKVKDYMESTYGNGTKRYETSDFTEPDESGFLRTNITIEGHVTSTFYPEGKTPAETQEIRDAAVKAATINAYIKHVEPIDWRTDMQKSMSSHDTIEEV